MRPERCRSGWAPRSRRFEARSAMGRKSASVAVLDGRFVAGRRRQLADRAWRAATRRTGRRLTPSPRSRSRNSGSAQAVRRRRMASAMGPVRAPNTNHTAGIPRAPCRVPPRQRRPYAGQQDQHDGDAIENPLHASSVSSDRRRPCYPRWVADRAPGPHAHRSSSSRRLVRRRTRTRRLQCGSCSLRPVIASVFDRSGPYDRVTRGLVLSVSLRGAVIGPGIGPTSDRRSFLGEVGVVAVSRSTEASA